jgi:D-alanyl-D-alanine carboxypeptidase
MMRRFATVCLVGASFLFASFVQAAQVLPDSAPFVPTEDEFVSAVVLTPKTHQVLYAFKPDLPHPAASLSKLPNALAFLTRGVPMSRRVSLLKQDEAGGGGFCS